MPSQNTSSDLQKKKKKSIRRYLPIIKNSPTKLSPQKTIKKVQFNKMTIKFNRFLFYFICEIGHMKMPTSACINEVGGGLYIK